MGHWYTKNGKAKHFITGKNGKERPTTLRDARKLELLPSVTEILNVAAKPGLERWKINQAYLAALTLPKIEGESLDDFKIRAEADAKAQSEEAMNLGSDIHADIERYYNGEKPINHGYIAQRVAEEIAKYTGLEDNWVAERTFSSAYGYGGMIDLSQPGWIIDYKTKDFTDASKQLAWDEHGMQLSAYAHGVGDPDARKLNVFVSTSTDLVVIHEWKDDYFPRFRCLLEYWKLTKNYNP